MKEINTEKPRKLIEKMKCLTTELSHSKDLTTHQHLNLSGLLEAMEELRLLVEQWEETCNKLHALSKMIDTSYINCFLAWHKDLRWLHNYRRSHPRPPTIL